MAGRTQDQVARTKYVLMLQVFVDGKHKNFLCPMQIGRAATNLESIQTYYAQGMRLKRHFPGDESDLRAQCCEWSRQQPLVYSTKRLDTAMNLCLIIISTECRRT